MIRTSREKYPRQEQGKRYRGAITIRPFDFIYKGIIIHRRSFNADFDGDILMDRYMVIFEGRSRLEDIPELELVPN